MKTLLYFFKEKLIFENLWDYMSLFFTDCKEKGYKLMALEKGDQSSFTEVSNLRRYFSILE